MTNKKSSIKYLINCLVNYSSNDWCQCLHSVFLTSASHVHHRLTNIPSASGTKHKRRKWRERTYCDWLFLIKNMLPWDWIKSGLIWQVSHQHEERGSKQVHSTHSCSQNVIGLKWQILDFFFLLHCMHHSPYRRHWSFKCNMINSRSKMLDLPKVYLTSSLLQWIWSAIATLESTITININQRWPEGCGHSQVMLNNLNLYCSYF